MLRFGLLRADRTEQVFDKCMCLHWSGSFSVSLPKPVCLGDRSIPVYVHVFVSYWFVCWHSESSLGNRIVHSLMDTSLLVTVIQVREQENQNEGRDKEKIKK